MDDLLFTFEKIDLPLFNLLHQWFLPVSLDEIGVLWVLQNLPLYHFKILIQTTNLDRNNYEYEVKCMPSS